MAGVLAILALGVYVHRRRSRPVLLKPEAFELDVNLPTHLVGRSEHLDQLWRVHERSRLIWLVGESGVGKSAVVRAGLLPQFASHERGLPIYLTSMGDDWRSGPPHALWQALIRSLSQEERNSLELEHARSLESLERVLKAVKLTTGREVTIIFDQFDDYLLLHAGHFVSPTTGTTLTADELLKQNSFWRMISRLLRSGHIRCLFVCRSDAVHALEAVRLLEPAIFTLPRLERGWAWPLLTRLTEAGSFHGLPSAFDTMKRRLIEDLEADGAVLPVRMRLAFSALVELRYLTSREYQHVGGLIGLESLYVQHRINEAARVLLCDPTELLAILYYFIDHTNGKGRVLRENEIDIARVSAVTRQLEQRRLIRPALVAEHTATTAWQLDHDYLSAPITALFERQNEWGRRLKEAERQFVAATGLNKWRALLEPQEQLRLLIQRIRGDLRYGSHRRFAMLSLVRLAVNIWIIAIALTAGLFFRINIDNHVRDLIIAIGGVRDSSYELPAVEDDLRRLTAFGRRALFNALESNEQLAMPIAKSQGYLARALIGADTARAPMVAKGLLQTCISIAQREPERRQWATPACAFALYELNRSDDEALDSYLSAWWNAPYELSVPAGFATWISRQELSADYRAKIFRLAYRQSEHSYRTHWPDAAETLAGRFSSQEAATTIKAILEARLIRGGAWAERHRALEPLLRRVTTDEAKSLLRLVLSEVAKSEGNLGPMFSKRQYFARYVTPILIGKLKRAELESVLRNELRSSNPGLLGRQDALLSYLHIARARIDPSASQVEALWTETPQVVAGGTLGDLFLTDQRSGAESLVWGSLFLGIVEVVGEPEYRGACADVLQVISQMPASRFRRVAATNLATNCLSVRDDAFDPTQILTVIELSETLRLETLNALSRAQGGELRDKARMRAEAWLQPDRGGALSPVSILRILGSVSTDQRVFRQSALEVLRRKGVIEEAVNDTALLVADHHIRLPETLQWRLVSAAREARHPGRNDIPPMLVPHLMAVLDVNARTNLLTEIFRRDIEYSVSRDARRFSDQLLLNYEFADRTPPAPISDRGGAWTAKQKNDVTRLALKTISQSPVDVVPPNASTLLIMLAPYFDERVGTDVAQLLANRPGAANYSGCTILRRYSDVTAAAAIDSLLSQLDESNAMTSGGNSQQSLARYVSYLTCLCLGRSVSLRLPVHTRFPQFVQRALSAQKALDTEFSLAVTEPATHVAFAASRLYSELEWSQVRDIIPALSGRNSIEVGVELISKITQDDRPTALAEIETFIAAGEPAHCFWLAGFFQASERAGVLSILRRQPNCGVNQIDRVLRSIRETTKDGKVSQTVEGLGDRESTPGGYLNILQWAVDSASP